MRINRVRFEAFKSLYDVECNFDDMTVVTGPNGSGKSNLVEGLNFLSNVYEFGLEFAVSRAGGIENIAFRRSRRARRAVGFTVDISLDLADLRTVEFGRRLRDNSNRPSQFRYRHTFSLKTAGESVLADYGVVDDLVELIGDDGRPYFRISRKLNNIEGRYVDHPQISRHLAEAIAYPLSEEKYRELRPRRVSRTSLLSETFTYPNALSAVRRALAAVRVFQVSPSMLRISGVPTPNAALGRYGDNLPGAAVQLQRRDKRAWSRVESAMNTIVPNLEGIEIAYTEDRRLALQFRERGVGRPWSTGEVSDGTVQILALFVALFDKRAPMLVIEEPENALHPWVLRQFIDICREEGARQILMTTHSPVLLNYVEPEQLRLLSMSDGRSILQPLFAFEPQLLHAVRNGEVSPFDVYDSGVIREALPRGIYLEIEGGQGGANPDRH